jgi:LPXTG-site transpeptidase (sortase) family protein
MSPILEELKREEQPDSLESTIDETKAIMAEETRNEKKKRLGFFSKLSIALLLFLAAGLGVMYAFGLQETAVSFIKNNVLAKEQTPQEIAPQDLAQPAADAFQIALLNEKKLLPNEDYDRDGLANQDEVKYGTDPYNPDTDGDTYLDGEEVATGYDPYGFARLEWKVVIPKLNINAPLVWSRSAAEEEIQQDLMNGLVHFPLTAVPGQAGNAFVTGHSSDYLNKPGNFKDIFARLEELSLGDTVTFAAWSQNGKKISYTYKFYDKATVASNDPRLFEHTSKSVVTLATCWPIKTDLERLMLKGELVN